MVLSARVPFRRYARNAKAGKPIYGVALTGPELKGRGGIHISIPTCPEYIRSEWYGIPSMPLLAQSLPG